MITFVGRADGVEISVGVLPEPGAGDPVVLLDLGAPTRETAAVVRLRPHEADRLSAALSAAAFAAAGRPTNGTAPVASTTSAHTRPEPEAELTEITAVEGTAAVELSAAIAQLPPGSVLVDFCADADVGLFFGPPQAADVAARPGSGPGT